jgi:hypothetical protein
MTIKNWLTGLICLGVAVRLLFWFVAQPTVLPDTGTYTDLAHQLLSGDFSNYEGRRTLGYPLLLIVAQSSPYTVWLIQTVAGLAISLCLFYIVHELTGSAALACLIGTTYNLNLTQLSYEAILLPETETTFFVVTTIVALTLFHRRSKNNRPVRSVLLLTGVLAGCAAMTRPQFVFLPIMVGIFASYHSFVARSQWKSAFVRASAVAAPGLLMILAWCSFNYSQIGHFTLSTHTGIGLMEHTIAFAELAPERYRTMRTILVKQRDVHLVETGRHTATWEAVPELKEVMGVSLPDLDRELLRLAAELIVTNPLKYAALVADAWVSFWLVSGPKGLDLIKPPILARVLDRLWRLEQPVLRAINACFLIFVVLAFLSRRFRQMTGWNFILTATSTIVLISSIFQAFLVGVDNTRYGVTVQPLIVLVVITAGYHLFTTRLSLQQSRSVAMQNNL